MANTEPLIISRIDEAPATLKARFDEWGYLYFQQYLSSATCNAIKQDFAEVLAPYITLGPQSGNPVYNGTPIGETDNVWDEVYPKIQALESFHGLFHSKPIEDIMKIVAGDKVFPYPMKMARISTPGKIGYETPPHQDAHSHHAPKTMAGIWIPLQDVTQDMGRLQMLPKSHLQGVRPVHEALGVGGVQCEIYDDETTWHVSDVKQGDVILFNACTVHRAEPNVSDNKARLSIDTRFCDYGAPVFCTNLEPHHGWRIDELDWDFIYRDWKDDSLKYYWKDYPNLFDQFGQGGF